MALIRTLPDKEGPGRVHMPKSLLQWKDADWQKAGISGCKKGITSVAKLASDKGIGTICVSECSCRDRAWTDAVEHMSARSIALYATW